MMSQERTMSLKLSLSSEANSHLVVLMHGVMGNQSHMSQLSKQISSALGDSALIHITGCYSGFKSLRGTQSSGDAVFFEISGLIQKHKSSLLKISLIGYSFGGIVATWVAGRLFTQDFFGLIPVNFVTIACPHLGAVSPHGGGCFVRYRRFLMQFAGEQTGAELSLTDRSQLLPWMADPSSPFHAGLKAFRYRALYANVRRDRTVPFRAAYFPRDSEVDIEDLPGRWGTAGPDFPHVLLPGAGGAVEPGTMPPRVVLVLVLLSPLIIAWILIVWPILILLIIVRRCCIRRVASAELPDGLGVPVAGASGLKEAVAVAAGGTVDERIARGLNELEWTKHGVLFTWRRDGICAARAHAHAVARRGALGADVVRHVALGLTR